MIFQGAHVVEQGVEFFIAIVKNYIFNNPSLAQQAIYAYQRQFPGMPIVLMTQDIDGTPRYKSERRDIIDFLSQIPIEIIPWREYTTA